MKRNILDEALTMIPHTLNMADPNLNKKKVVAVQTIAQIAQLLNQEKQVKDLASVRLSKNGGYCEIVVDGKARRLRKDGSIYFNRFTPEYTVNDTKDDVYRVQDDQYDSDPYVIRISTHRMNPINALAGSSYKDNGETKTYEGVVSFVIGDLPTFGSIFEGWQQLRAVATYCEFELQQKLYNPETKTFSTQQTLKSVPVSASEVLPIVQRSIEHQARVSNDERNKMYNLHNMRPKVGDYIKAIVDYNANWSFQQGKFVITNADCYIATEDAETKFGEEYAGWEIRTYLQPLRVKGYNVFTLANLNNKIQDLNQYIFPYEQITNGSFVQDFVDELTTKILTVGNWNNRIDILGQRPHQLMDIGKDRDSMSDADYTKLKQQAQAGGTYADVPTDEEWNDRLIKYEFDNFWYQMLVNLAQTNPEKLKTAFAPFQTLIQYGDNSSKFMNKFVEQVNPSDPAFKALFERDWNRVKQNPSVIEDMCKMAGFEDFSQFKNQYPNLYKLLYPNATEEPAEEVPVEEPKKQQAPVKKVGKLNAKGGLKGFIKNNNGNNKGNNKGGKKEEGEDVSESIRNRWASLLEGLGPEMSDGSAYWHFDGEENADGLNEMKMGTTYYRNTHPEDSLFNQMINVVFDGMQEMQMCNKMLYKAGVSTLQEGDNWIKAGALPVYLGLLKLQSPRIKADRNTIIKVKVE